MIRHKDSFVTWLRNGKFIEMLQKQQMSREGLRIWVEESEDDRSAYYDYTLAPPASLEGTVGGHDLPKVKLRRNSLRKENALEVKAFLMQSFELTEMEADSVMRSIR